MQPNLDECTLSERGTSFHWQHLERTAREVLGYGERATFQVCTVEEGGGGTVKERVTSLADELHRSKVEYLHIGTVRGDESNPFLMRDTHNRNFQRDCTVCDRAY